MRRGKKLENDKKTPLKHFKGEDKVGKQVKLTSEEIMIEYNLEKIAKIDMKLGSKDGGKVQLEQNNTAKIEKSLTDIIEDRRK